MCVLPPNPFVTETALLTTDGSWQVMESSSQYHVQVPVGAPESFEVQVPGGPTVVIQVPAGSVPGQIVAFWYHPGRIQSLMCLNFAVPIADLFSPESRVWGARG